LGSSNVTLADAANTTLELANTNASPADNILSVEFASLAGGGAVGGEVVLGEHTVLKMGGTSNPFRGDFR